MRKLEIALFAVTLTHFHHNAFERGCEKGFSTTKIENLTLFLIPLKCEGGEWP